VEGAILFAAVECEQAYARTGIRLRGWGQLRLKPYFVPEALDFLSWFGFESLIPFRDGLNS
jgi:hypothetical protein